MFLSHFKAIFLPPSKCLVELARHRNYISAEPHVPDCVFSPVFSTKQQLQRRKKTYFLNLNYVTCTGEFSSPEFIFLGLGKPFHFT